MITPQKLHSLIRSGVGVLSSKYYPSQRIDRITYSIVKFSDFYGIVSSKHINEIFETLANSGLYIDSTEISRGFIKVRKHMNV